MRKPALLLHAGAVAWLIAPLGCRPPTEAEIDITTDAACDKVKGTGISAGPAETIEKKKDYDISTAQCDGAGEIGSIEIIPPDGAEKNAPFVFKVVTSLGTPVDQCVAPTYGPKCIVARRAMRFVPQHPFRVPVRMSQACAGVSCPEDQTCDEGICKSATVDPVDCDEGSSTGCTPVGGDAPPWEKTFGGSGTQLATAIAVGGDSTVALAGTFGESVDLGGGPLKSKGLNDAFVATYSQAGNFRWARAFGGAGADDGNAVALGPHGDVYVALTVSGTADFGGGDVPGKGGTDVALVKLTSFGAFEWAIRLGGAGDETAGKVAVGADDNVYVSGGFSGSWSLGNTMLASAGKADGFVASFDSSGKVRWAKGFGGAGDDQASALAVDSKGNVYTGGYFQQTIDLGAPMPFTSAGGGDAFLLSLDTSGAFRWAKTFGSKAHDVVIDLAAGIDPASKADRLVATGAMSGKLGLDGTVTPAAVGGFVTALGADGSIVWSEEIGEPQDVGQGVAIASDGSVVVGGNAGPGSIFGSAPVKLVSPTRGFVTVLDPAGIPRWTKSFLPSGYGDLSAVGAAPNGFAYVGGWYTGGIDLGGHTVKSDGAEDLFLLRLGPP